MKTPTLIIASLQFGLFFSQNVEAQRVFETDYSSQADLDVFIVDYESQCDLKVYYVDYSSQASNDGLWHMADYASQADVKVFFVDYASQADLKIFIVDYSSQAGWRDSSKQHLLD